MNFRLYYLLGLVFCLGYLNTVILASESKEIQMFLMMIITVLIMTLIIKFEIRGIK